jgi:monovalent cation:H+ antiporter-2, CPA2 family
VEDLGLIIDFVLALATALVGGTIARRLGQPPLIGYLLAGVVIGPHTPGVLIEDIGRVQVMAEMGVALLMFALGVEFDLRRLRPIRAVAILGGSIQMGLTILLGVGVGHLLGFDLLRGVFLGSLLALSSTVVALRALSDRGDLGAVYGRIALGILIVQDLAVVPMMVILPALADPAGGLLQALAIALAQAALILILTIVLGVRAIPWLLERVAELRSRELFLLTIVTLALGMALLTNYFGLSIAFGAFLAGLIVSESDLSHQVLGEIVPFRDLFATLFFVSVGMLFNPAILLEHPIEVALLVLVTMIGKFAITTGAVLLFGYRLRVAAGTGFALMQVGEFSFVLAHLGVDRGAIPEEMYALILATALVTMALTPALLGLGPRALAALTRRITPDRPVGVPDAKEESTSLDLSGHVIICGYGRVGRELARALASRGFRYVVIEDAPHVTRDLKRDAVPCVVGDAGNPSVLEYAGIARARALAVTIPDPFAAERAVRHARSISPRLDIIARVHSEYERHWMLSAGASEVIRPEFEAALEFIRHTLRRYGVSATEVQAFLIARRASRYEETHGTSEVVERSGSDR